MKKMKFRKSFVTNIISIFLVFNIFSIFIFTYYVTIREEKKTTEYAKASLEEIVNEKSDLISISFDRIENQTKMLGIWVEKLINRGDYVSDLSDEYIETDEGTIIREHNDAKSDIEQSSLMVPNTASKNTELFEQINLTQELDEAFADIVKSEDVTWVYIVTKDNLLRCSPFYDVSNAFISNHSHISDVFYTIADEENDPEKKVVWTKPYTDYLGTGWTMTCSQPVYNGTEQFGVICLDVSIKKIQDKYFDDFSVGKTGKVYWLDNKGNIFYHPDYVEVADEQGRVYEKNIFDDETMSDSKKQIIKKALSEEKGTANISENGIHKTLVYSQISGTDSTLILELDNEEFVANNDIDASAATFMIFVNLVLAVFFAIILYYKFSKPMKNLIKGANNISQGDYSYIKENIDNNDMGIYEIEQLSLAFEAMNNSIENYTQTLVYKNKEIGTILETIDGAMMIVDINGNIRIKSKDTQGIGVDRLKHAISKVLEKGVGFSEQIVIDNQVYKNTYYPIGSDSVENIVVSSEQITDRILLEKEIQQIEKMAGVGQLSTAIVHELKNTLALIKGATYILKLTDEEEKNNKEIETINKAVSEAENVIDTLLDYSRKDSKGAEMIHIGTLINQILLLSKKELISKNISVKLNIDDSAYTYSSGREAIKVILQNIIINGIQAVENDGTLWITCQCEKIIEISIKDNGGGITVEPIDRIFEPFITTKTSGTGIGLWITKRLVTSLNGTIKVSMDTNLGETEFIVTIPVEQENLNE